MTVDADATLDGTVAEVTAEIENVDNVEDLDTLKEAEEAGKDRAGVLSAIEDRRAELEGDSEEVDDDEEETSGGLDVVDSVHPSELEPERRPVDVDVADLDDTEYEGETMAPLNAESWVILDGSHEAVPDELDGVVAAVIEWPTTTQQDPDTGIVSTYLPPEASITVKARPQGQLLYIPLDAAKEIYTNGRPEVLGFA